VLVVLLVVVLIWRGPAMLPRIGESLGRTVKGVRENLPGAMDEEARDSADSDPKPGS
jgi:Sec-independent protein translocase protein TatA